MTVTATPVPTLSRQYPHVDDVTDWRAKQSLRLLWDRVFDLEARLQGLSATQGDLVSAVNTQETQLDAVRVAAGEALAIAQGTATEVAAGGGGPTPGGPSTIPDYSDIVDDALAKFIGPYILPEADEHAGKAQITRQAAWDIFQVDPNIRLLRKTGGAQIYEMSTDKLVQGTDGSFADVASVDDHDDDPGVIPVGYVRVKTTWTTHGPDSNTTQEEDWIIPTEAIAMMAGPFTRV